VTIASYEAALQAQVSSEGRARIVESDSDFERIEAGDVLVATMTTPAYNVVVPLLGAVVTDTGGVMCHAAIVAREFAIPAVVGAGTATTDIPDGAHIRVDGNEGTVTLL
jgi:pyruvate,water dikinase